MPSIRSRAIVLRRTNYGEADRVLQLITPEGKVGAIAKGVRREKSKLASGIELFAICEVVLSKGKSDIATLTQARLVNFFNHIIEDYDRMQFGYLAIKLISNASEMVDSPHWYEMLSEILSGLDDELISVDIVQAWFYLRYASLMGYELSLYHDVEGKKIIQENSYRYDVYERGLKYHINGELSSDHIKLLRLISSKPLGVLAQISGIEPYIHDCFLASREHASI